jgi:hypothetical protein
MSSACFTPAGESGCTRTRNRVYAGLGRSLPMMPGMPMQRSQDCARRGVTSLFAAFNIACGMMISGLHRQHRTAEFRKFLVTIDDAELAVHWSVATRPRTSPQRYRTGSRATAGSACPSPRQGVVDQSGRALTRVLDRSDDLPQAFTGHAGPGRGGPLPRRGRAAAFTDPIVVRGQRRAGRQPPCPRANGVALTARARPQPLYRPFRGLGRFEGIIQLAGDGPAGEEAQGIVVS